MKQVSHNSSLILFKKILSILNKKSKIKLLITFVVVVFATFLEILSLFILQKSVDSIINKTDSLSTINSPFFFTILFVIILSLSTIANSYSVFKIGRTVAYIGSNWSKRCFEKIFSKDLIYGHSKRSDKMINLMINDVGFATASLSVLINAMAMGFIGVGITFYLLFKETLIFVLIVTSITLTYYLAIILTKSRLTKISKNVVLTKQNSIDEIFRTTRYLPYLKIESLLNNRIKNFQEYNSKHYKNSQDSKFYLNTPKKLAEFVGLIVVLISVFLLSRNPNYDSNVIIRVGIIIVGLNKVAPALNNVFMAWGTINTYSISFKNIFEILDSNKRDYLVNFSRNNVEKLNNLKIKNLYSSSITFKNVSLLDESKKNYIFKEINVDIPLGKSIAIRGSSGSGKSTFLSLASGLYIPSEGEILINGFPFIDSKLINPNSDIWQNNLTLVMQDIYYEHGKIYDLFCDDLNDQTIKNIYNSLEMVSLKEKIYSLPKKLDTNLSDPSIKLSGGQLQRLTLARLLFKNKPVLFLDEATSALDYKTKNKFINNLLANQGKTIWFVTHDESILNKFEYELIISQDDIQLKKIFNE